MGSMVITHIRNVIEEEIRRTVAEAIETCECLFGADKCRANRTHPPQRGIERAGGS